MRKFLFTLAICLAGASLQAAPEDSAVSITLWKGSSGPSGSGTVIASEGKKSLAVTNAHVVGDGQGRMEVRHRDKKYAAKLVATQSGQRPDLALVEIDAELPAAKVATELPAPGEAVRTFGFDYTGQGKMTPKSGKAVGVVEWSGSQVFVTTVPIVSGDSGAGAFNADGELVAVMHDRGEGTDRSYGAAVAVVASWTTSHVEESRFPRLRASLALVKGLVAPKPVKAVAYADVYARVGKGEAVQFSVGDTREGFEPVDPKTLPHNFSPGLYRGFKDGGAMKLLVLPAAGGPGPIQRILYGNCPNGRCPNIR